MPETRSYRGAARRVETKGNVIIAFGLLGIIGVIGVIGFMVIEGLDFTEAVYMTIITIATVGFQEVEPLSVLGMWFTSFLIIISFGIFVYAITATARYVIDGVIPHYYRDRRVQRRIQQLKDHVIICGYGRNGSQAALDLRYHKVPFILIESDSETIDMLRDRDDLLYIEGDATQDEVLKHAGIEEARAIITTLPTDADNLYVVLTAREINPRLTIISRASSESSHIKLKRAGATNVIMPDRVGGQQMAKLVTQPNVVEFLDYMMLQETDSVFLSEVSCEQLSSCFEGKSIEFLDIRNTTGANVIGLRREDKTYVINPSKEILLSAKDKIFVLGTATQISALKELLSSEMEVEE